MIDRFLTGCVTGIIMLAWQAIDAQWYVTLPVTIGIYIIGYIIANKLGREDE